MFFGIPVFMCAGVGIMKLCQLALYSSTVVSSPLTLIGILLGVLLWKTERKAVSKFAETRIPAKIYTFIYLSAALIFMISFIGLLEIIGIVRGYARIQYLDLINWKLLPALIPYFVAWLSAVGFLKSEADKQVRSSSQTES